MPIFPHLSNLSIRFCVIFFATIFFVAFTDAVFSQANTNISIVGQSQQPAQFSQQTQTQADKALKIAQFFGDGPKQTPQQQTHSQTSTSAYPNAQERLRLPDQNPLLPDDVPERERRQGVLSPQSHQNILARQQMAEQNPPQPTISQQAISQPGGWTYVPPMTPPIRQVSQTSGGDPESEAVFAALSAPPPLIPPNEPKTAVTMGMSDSVFDSAFEEISAARETSSETPPSMTPARLDLDPYNKTSPFLADHSGEQYADEYDDTILTGEESTGKKYSDAMPSLLPRKGEQKEKLSNEGRDKNPLLGFLPNSASPIMSVLSSLAIVLGVFFVLVWLMKRATPRQGGLLPKEVFEKLGSVPLSPKTHLHLFRLGGKLVLVSLTPDGMEPVAEVTDPDEVIHLIGLCKQNDPKSASAAFRQVLKQYTGENGPQQQQQMTGGFSPQQMQQYPAQQYQQQTVRRPVGMVRR